MEFAHFQLSAPDSVSYILRVNYVPVALCARPLVANLCHYTFWSNEPLRGSSFLVKIFVGHLKAAASDRNSDLPRQALHPSFQQMASIQAEPSSHRES